MIHVRGFGTCVHVGVWVLNSSERMIENDIPIFPSNPWLPRVTIPQQTLSCVQTLWDLGRCVRWVHTTTWTQNRTRVKSAYVNNIDDLTWCGGPYVHPLLMSQHSRLLNVSTQSRIDSPDLTFSLCRRPGTACWDISTPQTETREWREPQLWLQYLSLWDWKTPWRIWYPRLPSP